jgi:hypothetical protein
MELNPKKMLNNIIDNAIIKQSCLICQDNIYIDDKYYLFCCNQYYHEKCLAEYIGLNMYAKCPICHNWIKKEIKKAFDIIFDKVYKVDYMREKIKETSIFTQEENIYNQRQRSPTLPRYTTPRISHTRHEERLPLIPRLDLSSLYHRVPSPPRAPRAILRGIGDTFVGDLFNIVDEYGERSLMEDDLQLSTDELVRRLVYRGHD